MKKRLVSAFQIAGCIALLIALAAQPAHAQPAAPDSVPAQSAVLTIMSEPTGALVVLQGAHTIRGRTPFTVTRGLSGRYDIRAYLPGHEDWLGAADFDPATSRALTIRFTQKSGWRAAVRSGIFPGWGQRYTGQRGKAAVFGTLELAALALVGYEQYWYSQKVADLDDAEEAYLKGREVDEIQRLYASMESRRRAADQKYDDRQQAVMLASAIWAVNMLDVLLFQPSRNEGLFSQLGPDGDLRAGLRVEF